MDATEIIVSAAVGLLLAWEIVTIASTRDSLRPISDVVITAAKNNPVLIALTFFLLGHWFWQYCPPCN